MVKIGMTRRLDPMDRVRELGDASVPFGFDVHALFFSDDAVTVEADLHRRFADRRVNRVNTRREFFYASPTEARDVLSEVTGNLLEFTEEPEAEQYRLSLQMAESEKVAPSSVGRLRVGSDRGAHLVSSSACLNFQFLIFRNNLWCVLSSHGTECVVAAV